MNNPRCSSLDRRRNFGLEIKGKAIKSPSVLGPWGTSARVERNMNGRCRYDISTQTHVSAALSSRREGRSAYLACDKAEMSSISCR